MTVSARPAVMSNYAAITPATLTMRSALSAPDAASSTASWVKVTDEHVKHSVPDTAVGSPFSMPTLSGRVLRDASATASGSALSSASSGSSAPVCC